MSQPHEIAHDCNCNPSHVTGYIDADNDMIVCNRCGGFITNLDTVKLHKGATMNEHSRLDKNHYTRCKECLEDHMDFLDGLRQDEQDDVREMENACDE